MPAALPLPAWPDGAQVAVSLSFDVDAESAIWGRPGWSQRLSSLSERTFGVQRGLPRILDSLEALGIKGTFFIPGITAQLHGGALARIVADGHEVGHHGHAHLTDAELDDPTRREEFERGLEALHSELGIRPSGYRSPAWELTPQTLALLEEQGFAYDSSCMGDDRPYLLGSSRRLIELPVHWSLDDVPFFWWDPLRAGRISAPAELLETWLGEFDSAVEDGRHLTLTMHPEVIGRGHRAELIARMISEMRGRAKVWFATCADVARLLGDPLTTAGPTAEDAGA